MRRSREPWQPELMYMQDVFESSAAWGESAWASESLIRRGCIIQVRIEVTQTPSAQSGSV